MSKDPDPQGRNSAVAQPHPRFVRCVTLAHPEVGVVHMHSRWWRPNRVVDVWLFPQEGVLGQPVQVPKQAWSSVSEATSWVDALRIIDEASAPAQTQE